MPHSIPYLFLPFCAVLLWIKFQPGGKPLEISMYSRFSNLCSAKKHPDTRATGKAGNGKREREREAGTGKDHRWCAKQHRYDVKTH